MSKAPSWAAIPSLNESLIHSPSTPGAWLYLWEWTTSSERGNESRADAGQKGQEMDVNDANNDESSKIEVLQ